MYKPSLINNLFSFAEINRIRNVQPSLSDRVKTRKEEEEKKKGILALNRDKCFKIKLIIVWKVIKHQGKGWSLFATISVKRTNLYLYEQHLPFILKYLMQEEYKKRFEKGRRVYTFNGIYSISSNK